MHSLLKRKNGVEKYLFIFKVVDKSGKVGEFEDVSKVEKYEMAEDEYAKRTGKCLLLNFHGLLMQM